MTLEIVSLNVVQTSQAPPDTSEIIFQTKVSLKLLTRKMCFQITSNTSSHLQTINTLVTNQSHVFIN